MTRKRRQSSSNAIVSWFKSNWLVGAGTIAAVVAAYAAVVLLVRQTARWNDEDRPRVQASEMEIPPGRDRLTWTLLNSGRDDAIDVSITAASVDIGKSRHPLEPTIDMQPALHTLKSGVPYRFSVLPDTSGERKYIIQCIRFSNFKGETFINSPAFFYGPNLPLETIRYPAAEVDPVKHEKLSAEFDCSNL